MYRIDMSLLSAFIIACVLVNSYSALTVVIALLIIDIASCLSDRCSWKFRIVLILFHVMQEHLDVSQPDLGQLQEGYIVIEETQIDPQLLQKVRC